jgi:hypothetical protein
MRRTWSAAVVAVAVAVTARAEAPPKQPPDARGLKAPDYLSDLARQLLRERMARHGRDMTRLVQAVLLLERDVAQELARSLANEPRITRPTPGATDELNSALPEQFFVRQDELRVRAKALAAAAKGATNDELAARLGELTRTCVGCHTAYLTREGP